MSFKSTNIPSALAKLLERSEEIKNKTKESNPKESSNVVYDLEQNTSLKEEELRSKRQDTDERKKYAHLTFQFLCWFAVGLFFLIFLTGVEAHSLAKGFHLSDNVLITLITTSLSSIVGIFIFVMRYLFSNK